MLNLPVSTEFLSKQLPLLQRILALSAIGVTILLPMASADMPDGMPPGMVSEEPSLTLISPLEGLSLETYGPAEPWDLPYPIPFRYRSTDEFIEIMSEEAGEDVSWLVETYLKEVGMPELKQKREDGRLTLSWEVPGGRPFPMPVEVSVNGVVSEVRITSDSGSIRAPAMARVIVDPDSKIMRALPIIGDCEEQTDTQVQHNIDRFTRMAGEYGWTRD